MSFVVVLFCSFLFVCLFPVFFLLLLLLLLFWGVLVCLFVVIVVAVVLGEVLFCFCFLQFDCLFGPCFEITNARHLIFVLFCLVVNI